MSRDTYLDREHSKFDFDEEVCANCGDPIEDRTRLEFWRRGGLCPKCWRRFSIKNMRRDTSCPFPWMGDRCSLNMVGECVGDHVSNAPLQAFRGVKWWVTDYERCLQDYVVLSQLRLMEEVEP